MQKMIEMEIAGVRRRLPLYQVDEETYEAVFIAFNDVTLTQNAASALLEQVPDFDCILTEETQGVPLAFEMSRQAGLKRYIVARKQAKAHMDDVVAIQIEGKEDVPLNVRKLYLSQEDALYLKGKRVLLVDDCVLHGKTMYALDQLVDALGGYVAGMATILVQEGAPDLPDLLALGRVPVFDAASVQAVPLEPVGLVYAEAIDEEGADE